MGYTTEFDGHVNIVPPLNEWERDFLTKFAETRRMDRDQGPYYVDDPEPYGQGHEGVRDWNRPPQGQPGLWCQWTPDEPSVLVWDGAEKFYNAEEWMAYIIDHFLRPGAHAQGQPGFEEFTFDHTVNGEILASGEDSDDHWKLVVSDNAVTTAQGRITYSNSNEGAING